MAFRMLENVSIHGQQVNSTVIRVAVLQGEDVFKELVAAIYAAKNAGTARRTGENASLSDRIGL